jgi:hypothetical protein
MSNQTPNSTPTPSSLPYSNPLNPRHTLLRAGYPAPSPQFYTSPAHQSFTPTLFVHGFNIPVATFYRLWDKALSALVGGLYLKDFDFDAHARWEVWITFQQIYTDEELIEVSAGESSEWAQGMVWGLVYAAQEWVRVNKEEYEKRGAWPDVLWQWSDEGGEGSG